MRDEDRNDPFDEFFSEIERMMNEMMGPEANFRFEHSSGHQVDETGPDMHLDIHDGEKEIRVIADLPGVEKDEIELQCDGKTLHLEAQNSSRRYDEQITLPARVDEHSASATYNNGVLEVVFDRKDESTSIDV